MEQGKDAFAEFAAAQSLVQQRFQARLQRTFAVLHSFNPSLAAEVFHHPPSAPHRTSPEEHAAVAIQRVYRGFKARRLYRDLLYEKYEEEDERRREAELRRLEEGTVLLESIHLQRCIDEKRFLDRQRELERTSAATVIQRAFRRHRHLPLPMTAMKVIPGDVQFSPFMMDEDVFDTSAVAADAQSPDSDTDSDDEVFKKPHKVSYDSDYEEVGIPGIQSLGKLDLDGPGEEEMDRTSISVNQLPAVLDMSFGTAMKDSGKEGRGTEVMERRPLDSPTKRSRVEANRAKAEMRLESVKTLRKKFSDLTSEANRLSEELVEHLERREALRDSIEFSKRLLHYLSTF